MIQRKKKICTSCGEEKYIFSKKRCEMCAKKEDRKPLKRYTEKSLAKRKEERKGFPKFFQDAIEELKRNPVCQNCGLPISADHNASWNIAHLLSKGSYKSVSTDPYNYVFLCSSKDLGTPNDCHKYFDDHVLSRPTMNVWKIAKEKYLRFSDKVLEVGVERTIFEEN